MSGLLNGKIALVTGAASGIGKATATAMAAEGASVVLGDVSDETGEAVAGELTADGAQALYVHADVAASSDVNRLFDSALSRFGRIDCAFNNAGIAGDNALTAEITEASWERMLSINITGVWLCMRREIDIMLEHGGGAIVNTASVAGLVGWHRAAAYSAAKHAVVGLTKSAGIEYGRRGIRINAVCPGVIETPMSAGLENNEVIRQRLLGKHPVGRFGEASEIADTVIWLCSERASFTTAQAVAVDGGYVAR